MYMPYLDRIEAATYEEARQKALETCENLFDYTVSTLNKFGLTFTHPFSIEDDERIVKVDEGLWDVCMNISFPVQEMSVKQRDAYNKFLITLTEEN